jgi:hypothetical protein
MDRTLVLVSSNREIEPETKLTLHALQKAGAVVLVESGSADVAYARNRALSFACDMLREREQLSAVLMLDDDMCVEVSTAQRLVDRARECERAVSAVYATRNSKLAGCRWPHHPGRWLVGLGCVAIPRALLLALELRSERFASMDRFLRAFTWCGAEDGNWIAEDYRLSMRLGGVELEPVGVGHIKKGALWPDEETIAAIAAGTVPQ